MHGRAIIRADFEEDLCRRRQEHRKENLDVGIPKQTRRGFGQLGRRQLIVHLKIKFQKNRHPELVEGSVQPMLVELEAGCEVRR